jgi:diadenylate cyclase
MELVTAALIILFCITGIWLSFSKGMETLAEHEIPVEFINPDQKMEIISSSASSVKLLISGARPLIKSIKPEQIHIKLNLSQAAIGVNKLAITKENILLPPGIQLKKIDPSELDITLDTLIRKELPIQPNWTGKLPKGLIMKEAKALPETIQVTGGGMALKDISTIFTEQILLDKLTESGTVTTGLILTPPSLRLKNSKKIQIKYLISKKSIL